MAAAANSKRSVRCALFSSLIWFGMGVEHMALTAGSDGFGVAVGPEADERKAQRSYWEEHSRDLTVEAMMLDSRAAELDKEERPEVTDAATTFFTPFLCV